MIGEVLKKSAKDAWSELFNLALYNIIWISVALPGLILAQLASYWSVLLSVLLLFLWNLPISWLTFGLFYTAYDIGQAKSIKFRILFSYSRRMWREASIWGTVNLAVLVLILYNLNFYAALETSWGYILQLMFVVILMIWVVVQFVVLPLYPRLEEPELRQALRQAVGIVGSHPLIAVFLIFLVAGVGLVAVWISAVALFLSISLVAILSNRLLMELEEEGEQEAA